VSGALAIAPHALRFAVRFGACFACLLVLALVAADSLLDEGIKPRRSS
jgi:hypothetical protein